MEFKIPYAKEEQLPSFEKIKEGFRIIDSLKLDGLSYTAIRKIFMDNLHMLPQLISPDGNFRPNIFRARVFKNEGFDISTLQSFRNPIRNVKRGRVNLADNPVFYGSLTGETALRECPDLEQGDIVYLSVWKLSEYVTYRHAQFLFSKEQGLGKEANNINDTNHEKLLDASKTYSQDKKEAFLLLNNKLANYFISDDYSASSFLGHYFLYDGYEDAPLKPDAIIYPSIKNGLNNFNFAFHPTYANKFLNLSHIFKLKFNGFINGKAEVILENIGFANEKEELGWFIPRVNPHEVRLKLKEVGLKTDYEMELKQEDVFVTENREFTMHQLLNKIINTDHNPLQKIIFDIDKPFKFIEENERDFSIHPNPETIFLKKENELIPLDYLQIRIKFPIYLSPITNPDKVGKLQIQPVETSINKVLCLDYSTVYGDTKAIQNPEDLIRNIPTESILKVISEMMADIHWDVYKKNAQLEIVSQWISRFKSTQKRLIHDAVNLASDLSKGELAFLTYSSSLLLIQKSLKNYCVGELRKLSPDEEERLFKAYLLITEEWTKQQVVRHIDNYDREEQLISFFLPVQIRFHDLENQRDVRCELVKAIYFFKFIEHDEQLGGYFRDFLEKHHIKNGFEYIIRIVGPIPYLLTNENRSSAFSIDEKYEASNPFWKEWCVETITKEDGDFTMLREKPLFRLKDGRYIVLSFPFLFDKIFQAIQFDFSKILQGKGITQRFDTFKSKFYSESFSEEFMFYNVMNYILPDTLDEKLNGKEIYSINKSKGFDAKGLDFYLRLGTTVLIFEFKDSWIAAKDKITYDYQKIKEDILLKLANNKEGKSKGLSQLVNFITNKNNCRTFLRDFDFQEVNIYPIVVVTDNAYTSFGINWLPNQEFKNQLSLNEKETQIVHGLSIISLDSLIKFMEAFNEGQLNLFELVENYELFLNDSSDMYSLDKFKSFSHFIHKFVEDKGIKSRPMHKILREEISEKLPIS